MYDIPKDVIHRFSNIDALVEADSVHIMYLMMHFSDICGEAISRRLSWKDEIQGVGLNIDIVKINDEKCSIFIHFSFSNIDGKRICFWHTTSRVVDYDIVDNWFKKNLPGIRKTDVNNFYSALR